MVVESPSEPVEFREAFCVGACEPKCKLYQSCALDRIDWAQC
jgi:hypothetical protein